MHALLQMTAYLFLASIASFQEVLVHLNVGVIFGLCWQVSLLGISGLLLHILNLRLIAVHGCQCFLHLTVQTLNLHGHGVFGRLSLRKWRPCRHDE